MERGLRASFFAPQTKGLGPIFLGKREFMPALCAEAVIFSFFETVIGGRRETLSEQFLIVDQVVPLFKLRGTASWA
jgi:hypothetical protein